MTELINGTYFEASMIGQGAFGQIFLGQNVQTKQLVAIKKESANCKSPQLEYEAKIYKCLEGGMGIPKVYYQQNNRTTNIMVMDLLGPSLEDMFNYCYRHFSIKTVLMLGIELLTRLEFIHHRNFIHRDIKPDNFALGLSPRANVIYVLDFGLAKRYRTPGTKEHIPYREKKSLTGTPRYASINNHMGIEQSRRDDLESLGYVLIYFLKGRLPWQGLQGNAKKQKYEMIMKYKMETSLDSLCEDLPLQFKEYMTYCRKLGFDQVPDYRYLRRLFKNALDERNLKNDGVYDWVNGTEKFNDLKLPKHCRNQSGFMLSELKSPAPAEFREMYKEEAYRNKTNVRLPQMNSSSHLHSYSRSTSTTPSSSTYLPMSSPRQSPLPDFKSRQPVSQNHLYPPFYSSAKPSFSSMRPVRPDMTQMYYVQQNNKNYPNPLPPSLNHYQSIPPNPPFRTTPIISHSTVGNRMNTDDRFKKQGENPSEVIAERKNFPRPM